MDTSSKPQQFSAVINRVKAFQAKAASDASAASVPDPTNKGTVGIPSDSEATHAKQNIPENKDNTVSNEGSKLEDKQLQPVSTGKNVPSTQDGNKKEQVSSPTDPLSKIASRIAGVVEKIKAANATPTTANGQVPEKDKDLKKADKPKADVPEGVPGSEMNKDKSKTKAPVGSKEAANDQVASDISPEALMKLASIIMATEGGLEAVEPVLMKAAGVEACRTIMSNAAASYDQFIRQQMEMEEYQKAASAQASAEEQEFVEMLKEASANDHEQIVKYATIHSEALNNIEDVLLKQAYMQGAGDAAAMQDSAPPPPEGGGAPPPEGGGEPDGDEGQIPGGGGGAASIEEIAQLLSAMVQSGEIDQQTAEGALQELVQAMQGGAAGGAPPEGGMPPEGAAPPEGEPKMAFDKSSALCTKLISSLTAKK